MSRHVALVEDDQVILDNYGDFLLGLGFNVDKYSSKTAALNGLVNRTPELVLLDVSLNGERDAGFAICADIRRHSPLLPIIFLSSHDADVDRISGLRLGADDYITKDVSLDFLVVRIEALFRRRDTYAAISTDRSNPPPAEESSDIEFDLRRSTVKWRAMLVDLSLTQFWILHELCRSPGHARTTNDLMRAANLTVEPNTIAAHIKAIRSAFLEIDPRFEGIRTERGRGYRWLYG